MATARLLTITIILCSSLLLGIFAMYSKYDELKQNHAISIQKNSQLSLTIEQMNREHSEEVSRLHQAMNIYVEQTKKDQIRLTELQNAIRGIEDEETKKCFDTRVPDAVLDSLFH